jgi:small-conductance mechanosensitive channel
MHLLWTVASFSRVSDEVRAFFERTLAIPDLGLAAAAAVMTFLILFAARLGVLGALNRLNANREGTWGGALHMIAARASVVFFFAVAVFVGSRFVKLPPQALQAVHALIVIAGSIQLAIWLVKLLIQLLGHEAQRRSPKDATLANAMSLVRGLIHVGVWSIALLLILQNLGFNITALIAGLGIGGVAVGLAAQGVISDLFASLSIILDKPFVIGDFISFDDFSGTVERIGLKTTRIRSLSGEQIVISNTGLLNARIRNFKRMAARRVATNFGILYDTPPELVERVPQLLRDIVAREPRVRFERCHFKSFGNAALDIELVYTVLSAEYLDYMDAQQEINLSVLRRFRDEGIEFAFPSRTVFVPLLDRGAPRIQ